MKTLAAVLAILFAIIGAEYAASAEPSTTENISGSYEQPAAPPPRCTGRDAQVAVPGAPHGMFVWAPGERMTELLKQHVIGKDPTLCGASIVLPWADLEKSKGAYNFSPA